MKHCPHCDEDKELKEFGKNRKEKSGLATYCKTMSVVIAEFESWTNKDALISAASEATILRIW